MILLDFIDFPECWGPNKCDLLRVIYYILSVIYYMLYVIYYML